MNSADTHFGLTEVTAAYGPKVALHGVSVSLDPGEVTAVVGGDGAGKTTLLKTLVGLHAPSAGIVHAPPDSDVGFLPATAGSWGELSVLQNMQFVMEAFGLRDEERIQQLLSEAGLWNARHRLASALSGGMRKKLGFCMAVLPQPALLVLDEPSTGVDPVSRVDLWRLVSTAAASGTTVIMATTYLDEAERANHVLVLDDGHVLLAGPPTQLAASIPGTVVDVPAPGNPKLAWRHGRRYLEWLPPQSHQVGEPTTPDLETAVIVASLQVHHQRQEQP